MTVVNLRSPWFKVLGIVFGVAVAYKTLEADIATVRRDLQAHLADAIRAQDFRVWVVQDSAWKANESRERERLNRKVDALYCAKFPYMKDVCNP